MRKLILASATVGILAAGGIANANADTRDSYERQQFVNTQQESAATARGDVWVAPGITAPAYTVDAPAYRGLQPMYEGRNVYDGNTVYVEPAPRMMYRPLGSNFGTDPSYADRWYQQGDAAIVNQERANGRSTR